MRPGHGGGRRSDGLLALALFFLYIANGRAIGAGDTVPATLIPLAIARGDGPFLDRFADSLRDPLGRVPGYAQESRGHVVSRYPIGPAVVALPFALPQIALLDWLEPSWDRDPIRARADCNRIGKNAAAAIVALTAAVLLGLLRRNGLGPSATLAVLVVAVGSDAWSMASQALWQHGPAALCLALAWQWLEDGRRSRLALAGLAAALVVACRPVDVVFAGALAVGVARTRPRPERLAFFLPAGAAAVALAAYHVWFFDTLLGGYAKIEQMHPWAHGTRGTWTAPFVEGATGTLLSPSHGLFVFCPWLPLALLSLPAGFGRLGRWSPARLLLWGLLPTFVLLSKYSCWWAGHCFGPRFWIDAGPVFALVLAIGLDDARRRGRGWRLAYALAIAWAIGLQAVGAACYPSTWHGKPVNVDRHHERLWDWRDTEVTRGLREGVRPRGW